MKASMRLCVIAGLAASSLSGCVASGQGTGSGTGAGSGLNLFGGDQTDGGGMKSLGDLFGGVSVGHRIASKSEPGFLKGLTKSGFPDAEAQVILKAVNATIANEQKGREMVTGGPCKGMKGSRSAWTYEKHSGEVYVCRSSFLSAKDVTITIGKDLLASMDIRQIKDSTQWEVR